MQAGTHGPAVIEGPATALSWLTVLPVRGSAQAFDRITGARVIANLPVVGLVVAPHHMLLVAMALFAVLLGIRYRL